jgi:hypothetical protein
MAEYSPLVAQYEWTFMSIEMACSVRKPLWTQGQFLFAGQRQNVLSEVTAPMEGPSDGEA